MAKSFDTELAALEALRESDPGGTEAPLRKALGSRNNFLVAKAAKLVRLHGHGALVPELIEAFRRFLDNAVKTDPQCWAKNALAEALASFDAQEPELFLAGMRHVQMEATWGGTMDTAGPLRGACALALVTCRALSSHAVLRHLTPLFADRELPVQVNAARAVEQIGSDSAALLLKLRAELGSGEPEVLGACYSGVLRLEGPSAMLWAAEFLHPERPDGASDEAAFAIADLRTEAAAAVLLATYRKTRDPKFRGTLLTALALTRQEVALEFLFGEIADGNRAAREALENSAPGPDVVERLGRV